MKRDTLIGLDRIHRRLGAALGAIFVVIAFSGAVSVFRHELDLWGNPHLSPDSSTSVDPLEQVVESALKSRPLESVDQIVTVFPQSSDEAFRVLVAPGEGEAADEVFVGGVTKANLGRKRNPAADWMFQLHAYLLTESKLGRYAVGVLGLAFLVSTITGFFTYRHRKRDAYRLEWNRGVRRSSADAHKALGLWALTFHLMVGLTGTYLGLKDLFLLPPAAALFSGDVSAARAAMTSPRPSRTGEAAEMVPLETILASARSAIPEFEPNVVILDLWGDRSARITVRGTIPGHLMARHEAVKVEYRGIDGKRLAIENGITESIWTRIFHAIAPLHYGNMGGPGLKWIYFALGVSTTILAITGLLIRSTRRTSAG